MKRIAKQNKNLPKGIVTQEQACLTPGKEYHLEAAYVMGKGAKPDKAQASVMDDDGWVVNMSRARFRK